MYSLPLLSYTDSLRRDVHEAVKWMCLSYVDAYPMHCRPWNEPVAGRLQKPIICSINRIEKDQKKRKNIIPLARFEPRTSPYFVRGFRWQKARAMLSDGCTKHDPTKTPVKAFFKAGNFRSRRTCETVPGRTIRLAYYHIYVLRRPDRSADYPPKLWKVFSEYEQNMYSTLTQWWQASLRYNGIDKTKTKNPIL